MLPDLTSPCAPDVLWVTQMHLGAADEGAAAIAATAAQTVSETTSVRTRR